MRHNKKSPAKVSVPQEIIENKILLVKGEKVMLDKDLAKLYGVETNEDFMFQLSKEEFEIWRRQFGTSNPNDKMGLRYSPYAFTDYGILMLSSVLNSKRAIQVNIQIMRTFTRLKEIITTHKDLQRKIEAMERKYDQQFKVVFDAIKQLLEPLPRPKRQIGFYP
ncbi:MAG: DNA-binding protein [Candidatus Omnitrophica bacterium 4484_171]|nr:MAG: DNA-binding protein [Candidatus Omnitrophica bacterium 4484_171]